MKKRIKLSLQRLLGNLFDGIFPSYLNAPHGLELDEIRQYQPGDDFRSIDWKTTARTGKLHVRIKLVDKRVTILFLVDKSRSGKFGSFINTKECLQSSVLLLLVHAASETGNEIGFITFTDRIETYIQPKTGEKEALKNVKNILQTRPTSYFTDLNNAFTFVNERPYIPSLVFILSDFLSPYNYEQSLKTLSYLHEVIPIIISDRTEISLPNKKGFLSVQDMETGITKVVDTSTALAKPAPYLFLFKKLNLDHLALSAEEDEEIWIKKVSEFFDQRIRRGRRRRR
ncbi:MAG: DUF58 domain-containing protein [Candidatus Loosdrechtia sp.]|uniref:DUF58 domain-containing protein n=1 Tax=Candidatus Loosdrechtia sp. TaxID=3101272 RepID=UPI003A5F3EA3|nr:MAG: DUF58 domain-containing protein [Candidatus Jettenia sp. AMX2]